MPGLIFVPKRTKNTQGADIGYIGMVVVVTMDAYKAAKTDPAFPAKLQDYENPADAVSTDEYKDFMWAKAQDINARTFKSKHLLGFEQVKKKDYMHLAFTNSLEDWIEDVEIPNAPALGLPEGHCEQLLTATQKHRRTQLDMYFLYA